MRTSTRMTLAVGWAAGLGAIPLGAVYEDWSWLWYTWAAVLAVIAGHLAVRGTRLPALLAPVGGALALLLYLTLVFAGDDAFLGLIPTPSSMAALHQTLSDGLSDVQDLAAPVPADPGLVLLAAGAIGLLTIVMDLIAVVGRRPAAAGLALLGLYAVPTAVARDGIGWPLFVGGALGYLVLLMAEGKDRLLRWGRPIGAEPAGPARPGQRQAPDDPPPAFTGQRIGAAALAVAVVVPLFVPGLTSHTLADLTRSGSGGGGGGGTSVSVSPFTDLVGKLQQPKPTRLFTATSENKDLYNFRLMTLDRYTARGWDRTNLSEGSSAIGRVDQPAFQGAEQDGSRLFRLDVNIDGAYTGDSLPTAYYASEIQGVTSDWHYDSRGAILQNPTSRANSQHYTVTGYNAVPTEAELQAATAAAPDEVARIWGSANNVPDQVTRLVGQITAGRNTPYEKARALNDYFREPRNGFLYSTQTKPGNSGSALVDFLNNKRGYCEQYASALGIMLRAAGIPSRVVIGFLHPRNQTGQWDVSTSDAHAWVEAYFTGVGWAPFDPTPRDYTGRVDPPYAPGPGVTAGPSSSAPAAGGTTGRGPSASLGDVPFQTDTGAPAATGVVTPRTGLITLVALIVVALLLIPAVGRRRARRRRLRLAAGGDPHLAARSSWDELLDTTTDFAISMPRNETPRGTARRLARELSADPAAVAGLKLLALAEERARYAPGAGVEGDLPTATRAVRRGLRELTGRRRRLRAAVFPPSTIHAIRVGSARRSAAASGTASRLTQEILRAFRPRGAATPPRNP